MVKLKKNDKVKVLQGKEKGKVGKVLRIEPEREFVYIEGINTVKVHTRQKKQNQQSGIISKEGPVHISSVALVCPNCSKPARVGFDIEDSGKKTRVCKKCGGQV